MLSRAALRGAVAPALVGRAGHAAALAHAALRPLVSSRHISSAAKRQAATTQRRRPAATAATVRSSLAFARPLCRFPSPLSAPALAPAPVRGFSSSTSSGSDPHAHQQHPSGISTSSYTPPPTAHSHAPPPQLPLPILSPVETFGTKFSRMWAGAKAEARHYWLGTKLLWADIRIAYRLLRKIAAGHEMSRRERRQLLRTSADMVRMVPFVILLIIPFAEFALPVLLKFFPNMLPSTYLDSTGREAKMKKQLVVKMEMARFLQETTQHLAQQLAASSRGPMSDTESAANARSFKEFMAKVRNGQKVRNEDILKFTHLFDSELTLDNLDAKQLQAMCRMLDIKVFGSLWVLRYKLEQRLLAIQKDDVLIQKEGVEALDQAELEEACRARGIYTDKDATYLRRKLSDWLELSLVHKVPITLLLLSRAFSRQMTGATAATAAAATPESLSQPSAAPAPESEPQSLAEELASTLAHVPAAAVAEAEKEAADRSDDREERLKMLEEERVESEYEELQASKQGKGEKNRSEKIKAVKPALGVTKERLERLEMANDHVETLIDTTIAKEEAEEQQEQQQQKQKAPATAAVVTGTEAAAAPASATPAPSAAADTAAATVAAPPSTPSVPTPATASTAPSDASLPPSPSSSAKSKKDKKDKKTIAVVDRLNDRLGAMIEEIRTQAEVMEKQQDEEKTQQGEQQQQQEGKEGKQ